MKIGCRMSDWAPRDKMWLRQFIAALVEIAKGTKSRQSYVPLLIEHEGRNNHNHIPLFLHPIFAQLKLLSKPAQFLAA